MGKQAKSQRAVRFHSRENIFIIFAPCIFMFFLDNSFMTTPKCRFWSFVFAVLCLKKSLLIFTVFSAKWIFVFSIGPNCRQACTCAGTQRSHGEQTRVHRGAAERRSERDRASNGIQQRGLTGGGSFWPSQAGGWCECLQISPIWSSCWTRSADLAGQITRVQLLGNKKTYT